MSLVTTIHAAEPGRATHVFEVRTHAGPGICIQVGAEGEPTQILLPNSLSADQIAAGTDEIRRVIYGGGCSLEEFFRRVANASGMPAVADRDDFVLEFRK